MNDNFSKAVDCVVKYQRASTSFVSRELGIPYLEARDIMLDMEKTGVLSKPNYVGKRDILLEQEDLD